MHYSLIGQSRPCVKIFSKISKGWPSFISNTSATISVLDIIDLVGRLVWELFKACAIWRKVAI